MGASLKTLMGGALLVLGCAPVAQSAPQQATTPPPAVVTSSTPSVMTSSSAGEETPGLTLTFRLSISGDVPEGTAFQLRLAGVGAGQDLYAFCGPIDGLPSHQCDPSKSPYQLVFSHLPPSATAVWQLRRVYPDGMVDTSGDGSKALTHDFLVSFVVAL